MFIREDGCSLHIELEYPEKRQAKMPLVIVVHGFTGHMEEKHIVALSHMLNDIGCMTLRVEMYGHGQSDGEFQNHTLYKWLTNVTTVMDYAKKLPAVDRIYLCGHSQGGLLVMLAAAMFSDCIAGIIPISSAWMIPESARNGSLLGVSFDPQNIPDYLKWDGHILSGNYIRVAQQIDVENTMDRYRGPVLLVHGTGDDAVPFERSKMAAERYAHAECVLIEGDTHCFDHHLDQMVDAVRTFMLQQLSQ